MMFGMEPEIEEVISLDDTAERARRAHAMVTRHQSLGNEAARIRREAMEELIKGGLTHAEVGRMLDISRSRVSKLMANAPLIERALLGTGPVTIAVGGKHEAGKTTPNVVVSRPARDACSILAGMCTDYGLGLTGDYEIVPPPGMVDLNRDDLIIVGSPRILPIVGQVMAADEHFGFRAGARGWYLVDHDDGHEYRSPSDDGVPTDYAYIGRLERPDRRGTFLYIAGIHAMGTHGAALFIANHIAELYREVKLRRWSTLIACHYDLDSQEIGGVERIAPIHPVRQ